MFWIKPRGKIFQVGTKKSQNINKLKLIFNLLSKWNFMEFVEAPVGVIFSCDSSFISRHVSLSVCLSVGL